MKTCSFEGCDRKVDCKGLCGGHYSQQKYGKPLTPLKVYKPRSETPEVCSFEGCNKRRHTLDGLCTAHHRQKSLGKELAPTRVTRKTCEFPDCGRKHSGMGLCSQHRKQQINGKELLPLATYLPKSTTGICDVPNCGKPNVANGMCATHYSRDKLGKPLKAPIRPKQGRTPCSFQGCDKPRCSKEGLCSGHVTQLNKGKELTKLHPQRNKYVVAQEISDGAKTCTSCKRKLPLSSYAKVKTSSTRYPSWCNKCRSDKELEAKYGTTREVWEQIFDLQGRCCRICKATKPGHARGFWHTDHDHSFERGDYRSVRGILCHHCNITIGSAKDNPSILRAAADYLETGKINWPTLLN